jgi:hypothetical protein
MIDSGFFDEGLVAAAWGLLIAQNPYEACTIAHEEWRRGYDFYGVSDDDESDDLSAPVLEDEQN